MNATQSLASPEQPTRSPFRTGVLGDLAVARAFVGGEWRRATDGATVDVVDPSSGARIGTVPAMGRAEADEAVRLAVAAQPAWAGLTAIERATRLDRWAELMRDAREELARLMTLEQGKPLDEARAEIDYAQSFLTWFAAEGQRQYGEIVPTHLPGRQLFATWVPVGVVAAVTPWNFPSAMVTRKAAAALMAGCAMVLRPATETPYSALALAALAQAAGVPAGVFSVVTGDPEPIVGAFLDDPRVRKISFTGSTQIGSQLMARSASTIKRISMELGGHAPFLVFEDADLEVAVAGAVAAKFQTSGQDCLAANRVLVARPIYERFCREFTAAVAKLRVGNGFEPDVDIGPLIGPAAVAKCQRHVDDALARGARLMTGGETHRRGPQYFAPTVLADVTPTMRIFREETFGPVAPVIPFDGETQAIELANDSEFGLAAYCFGRNLDQLWRVADALEYGMIAVNGVKMTGPSIPFGGMKQSGLGREGSRHGINEYSELKYFCINRARAASGDIA